MDQNVRTLFESKYDVLEDNLDNNLNEYLFIEVYAFVLDKLRGYFEHFKTSKEFVALEDKIDQEQRLQDVLIEAGFFEPSAF